jgi:hypothetical protein
MEWAARRMGALESDTTSKGSCKAKACAAVTLSQVRASPLLKDASSALIQEVLLKLRPFSLVAGEWLYRAGDVGRDAVFVRTGTLQVVETSDTGTAVVTYTATAGSILGETSLFLTPSLRSSSVKAVTDAELHRCVQTLLTRPVRTSGASVNSSDVHAPPCLPSAS